MKTLLERWLIKQIQKNTLYIVPVKKEETFYVNESLRYTWPKYSTYEVKT